LEVPDDIYAQWNGKEKRPETPKAHWNDIFRAVPYQKPSRETAGQSFRRLGG